MILRWKKNPNCFTARWILKRRSCQHYLPVMYLATDARFRLVRTWQNTAILHYGRNIPPFSKTGTSMWLACLENSPPRGKDSFAGSRAGVKSTPVGPSQTSCSKSRFQSSERRVARSHIRTCSISQWCARARRTEGSIRVKGTRAGRWSVMVVDPGALFCTVLQAGGTVALPRACLASMRMWSTWWAGLTKKLPSINRQKQGFDCTSVGGE